MKHENIAQFGVDARAVLGASFLNAYTHRPFVDPSNGETYILQLHANGKFAKLRVNATALLQYQEWLEIDRAVIQAAVQRMTAVMDLRSRGLVHNLGDIGNIISLWDAISDITPADVAMSAITEGEMDTPAYKTASVPIPIVFKRFQVELRRLVASRRFGESIDVTTAALAGRRVAEKNESILFNGSATQVLGATIYGYTNHPDRNLVDMDTPWNQLDGAAGENAQIIEDVQAMQTASRLNRYYGPWVIYIPNTYETKLDEDYRGPTSSDTRTVRQRILALSGIEDIKVADFLTGNNVIMVQMVRDVVDFAIAQDVTTVQWQTMGGMQENFKVMFVGAPRLKSDFDGRSGITHLTPLPGS